MKHKKDSHIKVIFCKGNRHNNHFGRIHSARRDGGYNVNLKNGEICVALEVELLYKPTHAPKLKQQPFDLFNFWYMGGIFR